MTEKEINLRNSLNGLTYLQTNLQARQNENELMSKISPDRMKELPNIRFKSYLFPLIKPKVQDIIKESKEEVTSVENLVNWETTKSNKIYCIK